MKLKDVSGLIGEAAGEAVKAAIPGHIEDAIVEGLTTLRKTGELNDEQAEEMAKLNKGAYDLTGAVVELLIHQLEAGRREQALGRGFGSLANELQNYGGLLGNLQQIVTQLEKRVVALESAGSSQASNGGSSKSQ